MKHSSLHKKLALISPKKVKSYLVGKNWVEDGKIGNIATIWHRSVSENSDFEIIYPIQLGLRDYAERVRDLLNILSEYENRDVDIIFSDISEYFSDAIKVRIVHDDVKDGTIPLEDGVLLIEKTRELLTSAALSTLTKKKFFSGSRSQDVNDFINKARLGQTEIGSYIVNVIAPIDPVEPELFETSSFTRLVMETLEKSLISIASIVEDFQSNELHTVIDQAVDDGVSANLCDALTGLSGDNKSRDFQISISFSNAEKRQSDSNGLHKFGASSIPYIERVSEYLKENYVITNTSVSGIVKKLDRSADEESGLVTVTALVEDKERNVTFELLPEEYLQAIHAHENKNIIECLGDIYISPRSAKLINSHSFKVFGNRDLFDDQS